MSHKKRNTKIDFAYKGGVEKALISQRNRVHKDRKKDQAKKACRKKFRH